MPRSLAVIVNPISGAGALPGRAAGLGATIRSLLTASGVSGDVWVTEGIGHARELASRAAANGVSIVIAWGGDGTVNEVASGLAFTDTCLAVVPAGSGNGLARGLGVPVNVTGALAVALGPAEIALDVGEFDGRRFVNAAGIGLDAAIAHRFARSGGTRGLRRYTQLAFSEIFAYRAGEYQVIAGGTSMQVTPLLLTLANGRQFGNGAVIAPDARPDDGRLDLVIAESRSPLVALLQAPMLFLGGATWLPGVTARQVSSVSISSDAPIQYHVDGEPGMGGTMVQACVHPAALRMKVPAGRQPTKR